MKSLIISSFFVSLITTFNIFHFSNNFVANELDEKYIAKESPIKESNFDLEKILYELSASDKRNAPKLIDNRNGTKSILYKKNEFEKNLNEKELLNLIKNPKSFKIEKLFIKDSIEILKKLGIKLVLIKESEDVAATWNPSEKKIVINTNIIRLGTRIFAEVLNHEMIHIAQSCKAGSLESFPALIGLKVNLNKEKRFLLSKDIYKGITKLEKSLEDEAYTYQTDFKMGKSLIKKFCI
tara:strand:+ start:442 stop:1155 length:714 start_codon:yes stop_codon:yes gene_type:complete